jgi:signal transduction histidine kinase
MEGRLFEKFTQSGKGKGKVGLGLYFCRITTERWGGDIGHNNIAGAGSRFWFRLPAYEDPD